jgi:hypothetical protein
VRTSGMKRRSSPDLAHVCGSAARAGGPSIPSGRLYDYGTSSSSVSPANLVFYVQRRFDAVCGFGTVLCGGERWQLGMPCRSAAVLQKQAAAVQEVDVWLSAFEEPANLTNCSQANSLGLWANLPGGTG